MIPAIFPFASPKSSFGDTFGLKHNNNAVLGQFTLVDIIPASFFSNHPAAGTRTARLLMAGGFVDAYIGMAGVVPSFSGTPAQITINGSAGSTNAHTQMNLTDPVSFSYDGSSDIMVAIDVSVSSDITYYLTPPGGLTSYGKAGVNEASLVTKSGYSHLDALYSVWAIEIDGTVVAVRQPTRRIVCAGNSLTFGNGSVDGSYPSQLALNSRWFGANVFNVGVPSQTSAQLQALNTTGPLFTPGAVAVLWEITNSLYFGASAAQALSDYYSWADAVKAQGFKTIAVTCLPRTNSGTPGTFETDRQTCNADIRSNWPNHFDALADVGNDATIGQAGQTTNATYYADLVHLTDAGYALMYPYVQAALALT